MKSLHLRSILASDDYVKGPAYTLLSIITELDENVKDFVVVPSDTIFHPSILEQVFSFDIDRFQNRNVLFSIQLSDTTISKINQNISFTPQLIEQSSMFHSLVEENTPYYIKEYHIPILVLSRSFLNFLNDPENRISGKIIHNVEKYQKDTGNCYVIRLKYDLDIPPFLDIDTSNIYNTLNSVKKELLEPYKVK